MILRKPPEQSKWVERERPKHKTADFDNNSKTGRRFMDYSFALSTAFLTAENGDSGATENGSLFQKVAKFTERITQWIVKTIFIIETADTWSIGRAPVVCIKS